ncbi:MAG: LptE family protein [Acidobacteriota bacterium]
MPSAFRSIRFPRSPQSLYLLLLCVAPLVLTALSSTGCGYALVGRAANIPADVTTLYVQPFENRTPRSQVDQFVTGAVVDELLARRRFEVLTRSSDGADAEIRGEIINYRALPVGFDGEGRATEYEISLVARVVFQRTTAEEDEEPEVLWRNDRYQFRQPYEVEPSDLGYFDREDEALEEVSERFAETMVADLLEGF